jgi:hypothetical protein
MNLHAHAVRLGLAAAALIALTGCDRPKFRGEQAPPASAAPAPAAAPAAPAANESADPLPAAPAWAADVIGKPLRSLYPSDGQCIGNTDAVKLRHTGAAPGVEIIGWGWDPAAKAPVQRVVLIDRNFTIVGAGETGGERLDVPAARPEVTSKTTGWTAVTKLTQGPVDTMGVLADGKSVCRLGHLVF